MSEQRAEYCCVGRDVAEQRATDLAAEAAEWKRIADDLTRQLAAAKNERDAVKGELAKYQEVAQSEQASVLDDWIHRCRKAENERGTLVNRLEELTAALAAIWGGIDTARHLLKTRYGIDTPLQFWTRCEVIDKLIGAVLTGTASAASK
jgi:chromosome segregation ATPase